MNINFDPIQINQNVIKRQSKWLQVCPRCQCERIITYSQSWNIKTNRTSKHCHKCKLETGMQKINLSGLVKGRIKNSIPKNKFINKGTMYRHIFTTVSEQTKEKQRKAKLGLYGEKSNNWRGGKISQNRVQRGRYECKKWRKAVLERDKYTCQICFNKNVPLHADHIKQWAYYPELRLELSNGRALCIPCHKSTPSYFNNRKINVEI